MHSIQLAGARLRRRLLMFILATAILGVSALGQSTQDPSLLGISTDSIRDRARTAAEELAAKLGEAKLRLARILRTEKVISLEDTVFTCEYGGAALPRSVSTYAPETSAVQMVNEISSYSGLKPNFAVQAGNVPNAVAMIQGSTRMIVYNPAFMSQVRQASGGSRFALQSILAHEVGHHLQGHTIRPGGSQPRQELEADEYSGFILAKMGASLADAQAAMARIAPEQDGPTHPGRAKRLKAIADGYARGVSDRTKRRIEPNIAANGNDPWELPTRPAEAGNYPNNPMAPFPPSPRVATTCGTAAGFCPMAVPVPSGAPCYCTTSYGGGIRGIAR